MLFDHRLWVSINAEKEPKFFWIFIFGLDRFQFLPPCKLQMFWLWNIIISDIYILQNNDLHFLWLPALILVLVFLCSAFLQILWCSQHFLYLFFEKTRWIHESVDIPIVCSIHFPQVWAIPARSNGIAIWSEVCSNQTF